jgi:hypothetical protein
MVDTKQATKTCQHGNADKTQGRRQYKKKDPEAIPILCYGPSDNLMKFREAISNKALLDFGNLGKLIQQGYIVT